ncbi:hypothetical protein ColKHC_06737 [Colletotrichum higginsianum]|nr:hypothetical protein ColKHC_06737 [Colletotrichum higginsianum]
MAILNQLVRVTDMNHEHPEDAMPVAFISSGSGPTTISVNTVNTLGNENSTSFAPLAAIPNIGDTRKRLSYGQLITAAPDNGGERAGGGGNVLGLEKTLTQNSIIYNAIVKVQTVEQEALARTRLAALVANLEAFADLNDASTPWRFLNYVNPAQDPIKSYGEENVKFLKEVAAKYDPQGIFQTRVSGGFKLSRVS